MAESRVKAPSAYAGESFILTTKHAKSLAISPALSEILGVSVIEYVEDTDQLGTFSGEIERKGSALACVKRKCEWPLKKYDKIEFALASEGSFGPHPFIPFAACDQEILYFIDQKRNFHLHLSHISLNTNYGMKSVKSWEDLLKFAEDAHFPSHALILRPNGKNTKTPLFKGINTLEKLEECFYKSLKLSKNGTIWVETDMRAHLNPSRMEVIKELSLLLASRLATHCPKCNIPGWGLVTTIMGLPCESCGAETNLVKQEVFGCTKCDYKEARKRLDNLAKAPPDNCSFCNP